MLQSQPSYMHGYRTPALLLLAPVWSRRTRFPGATLTSDRIRRDTRSEDDSPPQTMIVACIPSAAPQLPGRTHRCRTRWRASMEYMAGDFLAYTTWSSVFSSRFKLSVFTPLGARRFRYDALSSAVSLPVSINESRRQVLR